MRFLSGIVVLAATMLTPAFGPLYADVQDGWTAVCSEPQGTGFEYGDLEGFDGAKKQSPEDGFQQMEDSFSNINPVFMYSGRPAESVTVVWGATKPDDVSPELFEKPEAEKAMVIFASAKRVTTIKMFGDEAWMTTHLPQAGVAFATRHQRWTFGKMGYVADATTFPMECDYTAME